MNCFKIQRDWRHSCVDNSFAFGHQLKNVRIVDWPDWMRKHQLLMPLYRFDRYWCPGCRDLARKTRLEKVPVTLIEPPPPIPLAKTGGGSGCVFLIHRRFSDVLDGKELRNSVRFGPVQLQDGSISNDWFSAVFRVRTVIRGTNDAGFRICPCRGRVVYFAMGKQFICPMESNAGIIGGNEVILTESFLTKKRKDWIGAEKGISLLPIKTTQIPLDGFNWNLPWYADENPTVFREYLATKFVAALAIETDRDRLLDLAIVHSEMVASGNGITDVLPLVEERLSMDQKVLFNDFLALDEDKKSVLPLYRQRGFSVPSY